MVPTKVSPPSLFQSFFSTNGLPQRYQMKYPTHQLHNFSTHGYVATVLVMNNFQFSSLQFSAGSNTHTDDPNTVEHKVSKLNKSK